MVAQGWRVEGKWRVTAKSTVSFRGEKSVLKLDRGDVCTTLNILKIIEK